MRQIEKAYASLMEAAQQDVAEAPRRPRPDEAELHRLRKSEAAKLWESNADIWTRHARAGYDVYRDVLNTPVFIETLPPVDGLHGLDIGCGEGANTRSIARLGARMQGIDIAPTFVRHAEAAETAEPLGIRYDVSDSSSLPFADNTFDFACSFMAFMDMADQGAAMREAARVLKPGAFFQFSILHPCFMPPYRRVHHDAEGRIVGIEVGRYFDGKDGELETWHFSSVPADERAATPAFRIPLFHRTLSEWVDIIIASGFQLEKLTEPHPTAELAEAYPIVEDSRQAPLFLHFRLRKPAA